MTQITISLILDTVMALLLAVTVVYCWKLNKRIKLLQDSKGELAQLIRKFDASTERASMSIVELQTVGKRVTENIKQKLEKANYLADDLAFMIERGNKLADKMELGISGSRIKSRDVKTHAEPEVRAAKTGRKREAAQRVVGTGTGASVRSKLQEVKKRAATTAGDDGSATGSRRSRDDIAKKAATLTSVLEKAGGRKNLAAATAGTESARGVPSVRMRSRAERELMEALKSGS